MEYWIYKLNTGEKRISPGPTVYEGDYWFVEHAYPVKTIGWMVFVLKWHAEALHELTAEEFIELGEVQSRLTQILFEALQCEKEYISCYAEQEHFAHIHFHVFARPHDFPEEWKGGGSFALLKVTAQEAVSRRGKLPTFVHC
jgi:diadenosine tetraphosphate (Ap4A) HIT family hydrolase